MNAHRLTRLALLAQGVALVGATAVAACGGEPHPNAPPIHTNGPKMYGDGPSSPAREVTPVNGPANPNERPPIASPQPLADSDAGPAPNTTPMYVNSTPTERPDVRDVNGPPPKVKPDAGVPKPVVGGPSKPPVRVNGPAQQVPPPTLDKK